MKLNFYKYHGTGNDFILIDNRLGNIALSQKQVAFLCNRRFGIGADGLMLLETSAKADFKMVYYNSDGAKSTMCGNGGRCISRFAVDKSMVKSNQIVFEAVDGLHHSVVSAKSVKLQMIDVMEIRKVKGGVTINTGSPHFIKEVKDVSLVNVFSEGQRIRNRNEFGAKGINVNFIAIDGSQLYIRTYERGVEDETLSCGTGVTAAAIYAAEKNTRLRKQKVISEGGELYVYFKRVSEGHYKNVWLEGPAVFVYKGEVEL